MRYMFMAAVLSLAAAPASGQFPIPEALSYQGLLEDSLGVPVPDGEYEITFRLYRYPNDATVLHEETANLLVQAGRFTHYLGWGANFAPNVFDGPLWLALAVDGESELLPRVPIVAVPFAIRASRSDIAAFADSAGSTGLRVAGGAAQIRDAEMALGESFWTTIVSHSIQAPAAGLVLVIATYEVSAYGFTDLDCEIGVSTSASSLEAHRDVDIVLDNGTMSVQSVSASSSGLFPVAGPGIQTFYLLGKEKTLGLDNRVGNVQFSLVYLPEEYGAVFPLEP